MATARANNQYWLSPAGRSFWTVAVSALMLSLLIIGGPTTLLPLDYARLATPAQNESEREETEGDESTTIETPLMGVACSRKTWRASRPPSNVSLLSEAGTLPRSYQLISALPVRTFAMLTGAGISMRC